MITSSFPADYKVETVLDDPGQVIGKRARMDIARGVPITENMITDAAMAKVHEKLINELALELGRVIQEIRLGKLRRDALRDMADRLGVAEMTSFVAAVIQSE